MPARTAFTGQYSGLMRQEPRPLDGPPVLASGASGPNVLAAATQTEPAVALPRLAPPPAPSWLRWPDVELGPRAGRIALAIIGVCTLAMVLFSTHGPTILVPRASQIFAPWEAGPLYHLIAPLKVGATATNYALSVLILAMLGA